MVKKITKLKSRTKKANRCERSQAGEGSCLRTDDPESMSVFTRAANNSGYNSVGKIAFPISGSNILDSGGGSGTTYTNLDSSKTLHISGGTLTVVAVDGVTLYTSAGSYTIVMQPGDSFECKFSSEPMITVFGQ